MADDIEVKGHPEETDMAAATKMEAKKDSEEARSSSESVGAAAAATCPSPQSFRHIDDNEAVLLLKEDKAVCTNDTLEDLRRALTYEAVFASLLEKKVLAMKRDCEERKRAKRMKRKSIGRIFFSKKLFGSVGSRKGSMCRAASDVGLQPLPHDLWDDDEETVPPQMAAKGMGAVDEIEVASATGTESPGPEKPLKSRTKVKTHTAAVASGATAASPTLPQADDSVASTLTNSSDHNSSGQVVKRNLLVRAQTHTPAEVRSSSSSNESHAKAAQSSSANGQVVSSQRERNTYDTTSLASGYENGNGARLHSSTMAEDSLTSMRDSIESLSFASSRCTVSFGGAEIIPEDTASLLYEKARVAKRLRVLEAKSISAQCSPILPRHLLNVIQAPVQAGPTKPTQNLLSPPEVAAAAPPPKAEPKTQPPHPVATHKRQAQTQTPAGPLKPRILPNQLSYTDSMYSGKDALDAAYSRYFTRQNTSEDSANLTVSTLLNQSDSLSLHAPICPQREPRDSPAAAGPLSRGDISLGDRYKSKSLTLLITSGNGRSRPPPPPPPPLQLSSVDLPTDHTTDQLLLDSLRSSYIASMTETQPPPEYYPMITTTAPAASQPMAVPTVANGVVVAADSGKLHRMTSTSTGSSVAPVGCCATTTKSSSRDKQAFKPSWPAGQTGSDDEYRRHKRKYKRHHRCSDPVMVYPSPSGLQHCILAIPPNEPVQFPYNEDFSYDMQIQIESDKNDDLEEIVPNSRDRRHRRHRRHKHKKRHRHKKPKILVQDLDTQVVKVIDPDELPQRARWTIIATACLLLLMCLMLVGITLRMAPIIDDMGE